MIIRNADNSRSADVDSTGRLKTATVSESINDFSVKEGGSFNLATGLIALTGTGESALLYIENTGTKDIVITGETMSLGVVSATATDDPVFTIIQNPTGGDIITDATPLAGGNVNLNHGLTSKTLPANVYQGKQGGTITGGNSYGPFYVRSSGTLPMDLVIRLTTGSSLGIKVDLNTSGGGNAYVALNCHLDSGT